MNITSTRLLLGCLITLNLCCTPRQYNTVMVRPATCSNHVQFAEAASLGHLLEFADIVRKPVFIDFSLPWVERCARMDKYVYTQNELASYFNKNFINYKVNVGGPSPGQALADQFGVTTFPTLVFLDGKGKVLHRHEGPATASQLLEMGYYLHQAVEKEVVSMGGK